MQFDWRITIRAATNFDDLLIFSDKLEKILLYL